MLKYQYKLLLTYLVKCLNGLKILNSNKILILINKIPKKCKLIIIFND